MLLQTNSYIVPKEKRAEHARLLQRFRQTLARLGCDHFEAYEQVGSNWSGSETTGRFVQIMRFRDRKHQQQVQAAEKSDPSAQALIREFCELINFPYQQQQGLFAVGFYSSALAIAPTRVPVMPAGFSPPPEHHPAGEPHAAAPENGAAMAETHEMAPDHADRMSEPAAPQHQSPQGNGEDFIDDLLVTDLTVNELQDQDLDVRGDDTAPPGEAESSSDPSIHRG
jgi:hypothetical protein